MKTIGFIGVGVMGKPMVRNLMKKGFPVSIYTRTKSKVLDVIEEGAVWCDDVKTCVQDKDVIITIVGYQIGRASCREECRSRWSPYH